MKSIITIFFLLVAVLNLNAQDVKSAAKIFAKDRIIIQTHDKTNLEEIKRNNALVGEKIVSVKSIFKKSNIYLIQLIDKVSLDLTMDLLKSDSNIIHISRDYQTQIRATPNDEFFGLQDGLSIIKAPQFWEKSTGGKNVNGDDIVVAIIDDGYDQLHEDLLENLWQNPGEIPGDNIDNDNNGYVDDVFGVNVTNQSDQHVKQSHGTSVAGIVGAKGDNSTGITGINWNVKLMLLSTSGSVSDIVLAYEYIEEQRSRYNESNGAEGAFVVASNSSFGIDDEMASDFPIWCNAYNDMGEAGIISTVATSNSSKDVDVTGDMPSTCTSPYIIAVTSTNFGDVVQGAFGIESIDMAAPGNEMYSCKLNNQYDSFGGTSAATPMVAGAIALMYSLDLDIFADNDNPSAKALMLRNAIVNSSRKVDGLTSSIASGGVLDLELACEEISKDASPVNVLSFNNISPNPTSHNVILEFNIPLNQEYEVLVHNTIGQLIYVDQRINDGTNEEILNLPSSNWTSGLYAVTIKTEEGKATKQFVKYF